MQQPPQGPNQPYNNTYYPNQQDAPQWSQVQMPGQGGFMGQPPYQSGGSGQYVPGQIPPPAQIELPPQPEAGYYPFGMPVENGYDQQPQQEPQQEPQIQQPNAAQGYQTPKTGMPRVREKKNRALIIAAAVIVLGFVVFAIIRLASPGQAAYGYVRVGSLSARYTGDALVVRSEKVYQHTGTTHINYEAEEGSFVRRGALVATAYASGFSTKELTTLNNYRDQIKEYHKALIGDSSNDNLLNTRIDQVINRTVEAQRLVQGAAGSLTQQEKLLTEAMDNLRLHLEQKYQDDTKLSRLYEQENYQKHRISDWSKQYAAPVDGLISFYTDGYETALNMSTYENFSPTQVRSLYKGNIPSDGTEYSRSTVSVYRQVVQEPWVVLMLCNEMDWTPVTGRSYKLLIESFDNTIVDATVESFTRSGGELLIRLRINDTSALEDVLYIRSCQVQLGENVNSLMVPSRAIYVQEGRKGVVMTTEGGEYWTGVEVVSDDGNVAYVIPENSGVLYDGVRVRLF